MNHDPLTPTTTEEKFSALFELIRRPDRTERFPFAWSAALIPLLQALRNWPMACAVSVKDPHDFSHRLPPNPSIEWLHNLVGQRKKQFESSLLMLYCHFHCDTPQETVLPVAVRSPFVPFHNEKISILLTPTAEVLLGISSCADKIRFLHTMASAFGANLGWFSSWDLSMTLPNRCTSFNPQPLDAPPFDKVPADVLSHLVSAVDPFSIDETIVPWSSSWIHFWSDEILDTLGRERILSLPWWYKQVYPGGALLCATEQRPDTDNLEALSAIAHINQQIDFGRFHPLAIHKHLQQG